MNTDLDFELPDLEGRFERELAIIERGFHDNAFMKAFESWLKDSGPCIEDPLPLFAEDDIPVDMFSTAVFALRDEFIRRFGFSVPTKGFIQRLASLGPLVEIGAGHGTLTRLINNAGGNSLATDLNPRFMTSSPGMTWSNVIELPALDAVQEYPQATILCSWPSLGEPWLTEAALAMATDQRLIVIGEGNGGCTASDCFHDLIGEELIPDLELLEGTGVWSFPGVHDRASAYRRA